MKQVHVNALKHKSIKPCSSLVFAKFHKILQKISAKFSKNSGQIKHKYAKLKNKKNQQKMNNSKLQNCKERQKSEGKTLNNAKMCMAIRALCFLTNYIIL